MRFSFSVNAFGACVSEAKSIVREGLYVGSTSGVRVGDKEENYHVRSGNCALLWPCPLLILSDCNSKRASSPQSRLGTPAVDPTLTSCHRAIGL